MPCPTWSLSIFLVWSFSVEVDAVTLVRENSPRPSLASTVLEPIATNTMGTANFSFASPKRCALIGSSASMTGKGRGSEIDAHDTVIRVNRLPTVDFFPDFGKRTTVLVGNRLMLTQGVPVMGMSSPEGGGNATGTPCASGACGLLDCRKGGSRCSFGALVFKREMEDFDQLLQAWKEAPFPVAATAKEVRIAAKSMLKGRNPSTGFVAFLAYFALCEELHVYGFDGSFATADGHVTNTVHTLDLEHFIMHLIVDGKLGAAAGKEWTQPWEEFQPDKAAVAVNWIQENLIDRRPAVAMI